jgi:hypothetical protein
MEEKYLPIGTVVLLKNATKPVMITGYLPISSDPLNTTMYDYSSCMFPEGILSSDQNTAFNHEQIDRIMYMGLKNETSFKFLNEVKIIANLHNKEKNSISKNIDVNTTIINTQIPDINKQPVSITENQPAIQANPFADVAFTRQFPQQQNNQNKFFY